ncbi:MAG: DUF4006 domain-containing protein [Sulfurospirillum sp.]|nr:MAG: DUF4006 domain-containing protein [Sulfurospirillum sp.]
MAENTTRRMCFNINGLLGGILATVLLLSILVYLTIQAIAVQQANATTYYKLVDEQNIQTISKDNYKHYQIVK